MLARIGKKKKKKKRKIYTKRKFTNREFKYTKPWLGVRTDYTVNIFLLTKINEFKGKIWNFGGKKVVRGSCFTAWELVSTG